MGVIVLDSNVVSQAAFHEWAAGGLRFLWVSSIVFMVLDWTAAVADRPAVSVSNWKRCKGPSLQIGQSVPRSPRVPRN